MSAHKLPVDLYEALDPHRVVPDKSTSSYTLEIGIKDVAICLVSTSAGAKTITLEDAAGLKVGTRVLIILDVDGGDLTIASDDTNEVLSDAGECTEFIVSRASGVNVWKVFSASDQT